MKLTRKEIEFFSEPLALVFPGIIFAFYTLPTLYVLYLFFRRGFYHEVIHGGGWIALVWGGLATIAGLWMVHVYRTARRMKGIK